MTAFGPIATNPVAIRGKRLLTDPAFATEGLSTLLVGQATTAATDQAVLTAAVASPQTAGLTTAATDQTAITTAQANVFLSNTTRGGVNEAGVAAALVTPQVISFFAEAKEQDQTHTANALPITTVEYNEPTGLPSVSSGLSTVFGTTEVTAGKDRPPRTQPQIQIFTLNGFSEAIDNADRITTLAKALLATSGQAQYSTDFSEYVTGQTPHDWTLRFSNDMTWEVVEDADALNGKLLRFSTDTQQTPAGLSWDKIDPDRGRVNSEVFFRFRVPNIDPEWTDLNAADIKAMFRAFGTGGDETLYRLGARPANGSVNAAKYINNNYTTLSYQYPDISYSYYNWYNVRAKVIGSSIKLRVWSVTEEEPDWQVDEIDEEIAAAGWIGLFKYNDHIIDIDYFAVGTNKNPAPVDGPKELQAVNIINTQFTAEWSV